MNIDDYMKERVEDQIKWLSRESSRNQHWFKKLRAVEIVMGCAIAYLVSHAEIVPIQVFTGALGVAVAAIGGLLSLYRFQEKWVEYRVTAESLKREKFFFLTGTAPYDVNDKFQILVTRVETVLAAENIQWAETEAARSERNSAGAVPDPTRESGETVA